MKKIFVAVLLAFVFVSLVNEVLNAGEVSKIASHSTTTITPLENGGYMTTTETTIEPSMKGGVFGAGAGAATGAAIGSFIPIIGTATGAAIGAIAGGIAGWIWGPAD